MNKIKLGFSSCPNDTFMFYGIAKGVFSPSFDLSITVKDIEELNKLAFKNLLDITKMSFFAYFKVADRFKILNSGAALGRGCGPLIIAREDIEKSNLKSKIIAIPGRNTTANLLFSIFFPECQQKKEVLFSDIEKEILNGNVDAGVIIHETRFTYQEKGLIKIADLGEMWENETGYPIPLGLIATKREIEKQGREFDVLLKNSILYSYKNRDKTMPFIKKYSQEIREDVINSHIELYVNDFSVQLGEEGKSAIKELYKKAYRVGLVKHFYRDIFLE